MDAISFDASKALRLRQAYNEARAQGAEVFTFEGHTFLVAYAKYLLEYLVNIGLLVPEKEQ